MEKIKFIEINKSKQKLPYFIYVSDIKFMTFLFTPSTNLCHLLVFMK